MIFPMYIMLLRRRYSAKMMRILFVCTGNSCRSPMAELYFDALCRRAGRNDFEVASAGIHAWDGFPASAPASAVLAEAGIDADAFRSRSLTPALIENSDLIVPMTAAHRSAIARIAPDAAAKIRLLLEFGAGGGDVPDPYGGSVEDYRDVFRTMKPALENLAAVLMK